MSSGLRRPLFPVVLAAPSGTGKTTIAHELVSRFSDFAFSLSATTRAPRPEERQGKDYDFVSRATFEGMIEKSGLAEWAEVHGHMYGTPGRNLHAALERGQHLVMDIDVQGAMQVRTRVPDAILVFVLPPSADTLVERLRGRGTEDDERVKRRLRNARGELERALDFDYVVVNEDLDQAVGEVRAIAAGEGSPASRAIDLSGTIRQLQGRIDEILEAGFISAPS